MKKQWSGIAAAGMAKMVRLSTTAANFPMRVIPTLIFLDAAFFIQAKRYFKLRLSVAIIA
jgi:hypothetical protein